VKQEKGGDSNALTISVTEAISLLSYPPKVTGDGGGGYEIYFPKADYQLPTGEVLSLTKSEVVDSLIVQFIEQVDATNAQIFQAMKAEKIELKTELGRVKRASKGELSRAEESKSKLEKEVIRLREENARYKENYGELIEWDLLLEELYRGKLGVADKLNPKSEWKRSYLKSSANTGGVNYWLSLFKKLDIFEEFQKGRRFARCSLQEANIRVMDYIRKGKRDEK
jgi:hypothetical protein